MHTVLNVKHTQFTSARMAASALVPGEPVTKHKAMFKLTYACLNELAETAGLSEVCDRGEECVEVALPCCTPCKVGRSITASPRLRW